MRETSQHTAVIAIISIALGIIGTNMIIPSMPSIAKEFAISSDAVQMNIAAFLIGGTLSSIFAGTISDYIGRRRALLIGMFIFAIFTLLCAQAQNNEQLMCYRFMQGFGACFSSPIVSAGINDVYSNHYATKIMNYAGLVATAGSAAILPIAGNIEYYFNWRYIFYLLAFIILLLSIYIYYFFAEANKKKCIKTNPASILKGYAMVLSNFRCFLYCIIPGISLCGFWTINTVAPFYFQDTLSFSAKSFSYFQSLLFFGNVVGAILLSRIISRFALNSFIVTALVINLLLFIGLIIISWLFPTAYLSIIIFGFLNSFANALLFAPCVTQSIMIFPENKGVVATIGSTSRRIFPFFGAWIAAVCTDETFLQSSIIMLLIFGSVSIAFYMNVISRNKK